MQACITIVIPGDRHILRRAPLLVTTSPSLLGARYWSLSAYVKNRVKQALEFIDSFEEPLARECASRGYDGVVCGHILPRRPLMLQPSTLLPSQGR